MKSIKTLAIAVVCLLAFSCNKKETLDHIPGVDSAQTETVTDATTQPEQSPELEMLKEAKSKPLTNIAFSETDHNFGDIKKGKKSRTYLRSY